MREILVVVDMQNDFVDGALGTREAQEIVAAVAAQIRNYPAQYIFATRDTHGPDYRSTQEGRKLPVVHCIRGTAGWEISPMIREALGEAEIIDKPGFGSLLLAEKLSAIAKDEPVGITLVGLCTDICVVSNALLLKAYLPEAPVRVLASCCAGVTPESHRAALDTMRMCQIEVLE